MTHFLKSESGAVTVDWVVLTAALVGLGLAVMSVTSSGVEDLSTDVDTELRSQPIFTSFNQRTFSDFYLASKAYSDAGGQVRGGRTGLEFFDNAAAKLSNMTVAELEAAVNGTGRDTPDGIRAALEGQDLSTLTNEDMLAVISPYGYSQAGIDNGVATHGSIEGYAQWQLQYQTMQSEFYKAAEQELASR